MQRTLTLLLPVLLICLPVLAQDKDADRIPLKIAKDTTFFTGPLTDDGIIDYVSALNKHYGEGIKNEDNAFALMVQLFARKEADRWEDQEAHWSAVFNELGIEPNVSRARFVDWEYYAKQIGLGEDAAADQYGEVLDGPWYGAEHPELKAWLQANDVAMALFLDALKRDAYFSPLVATDDERSVMGVLMPQLGHCRELARQILIRFYFAVGQEDMDTAIDLAWSIDRLGYHLSAEQHLIGKLVGFSCRSMASEAIKALSERGQLSSGHAMQLFMMRVKPHDLQSPQESIHYSDRCGALEQAQVLFLELHKLREGMITKDQKQVPAVEVIFNINQSLLQLNVQYDRILSIMREEDVAKRQEMSDVFEAELDAKDDGFDMEKAFLSGLKQVVAGEGFSAKLFTEKLTQQLALLLTPAIGSAERTEKRIDARRLVEATAIALLGYRDQHGELPDSLDALVPTYFDAVPIDFATGKPLIYRINGDGSALVYSLGDNLKDDGGKDDYTDGDIAIRIGSGKP